MAEAARSSLLALRARIRAIEGSAGTGSVLPFGVAAIDDALPGGGLALAALHEVTGAGRDEEDGALAAAFAAGVVGRLARRLDRPVLWCLALGDLYAPGLAASGLLPARLILARGRTDADLLWAMEEGLRSGALAAVVGEIGLLPATAGRRLQLACEAGGVTAIALRRWRNGAAAEHQRGAPSVAVTRWRIAAAPSEAAGGAPGIGAPLWHVELLRCRGGRPAQWLMEAVDATGHVALPAALADRPADAAGTLRRAG
jgi:protein ImuA